MFDVIQLQGVLHFLVISRHLCCTVITASPNLVYCWPPDIPKDM